MLQTTLQPENKQTALIVSRVLIVVNKIKLSLSDEERQQLKSHVAHYTTELIKDMRLPASLDMEWEFVEASEEIVSMNINGTLCRKRMGALENFTEAQWVSELQNIVYANRQLFISQPLADYIQEVWSSSGESSFLSRIPRSDFCFYLKRLVHYCFNIDHLKRVASIDVNTPKENLVPVLFEKAFGSMENLRVVLYINPLPQDKEVQKLRDTLELMQDGLFYELGVRIPKVSLAVMPALPKDEFCLQVNDLRLPPIKRMAGGHLLVNESEGTLKALNIEGTKAKNPANRNDCTVVKDTEGVKKILEQEHITTWDDGGYIVLAMSARLRKHAGCFVVYEVAVFEIEKIRKVFPQLVHYLHHRFDDTEILQVLRCLLEEEISIRDLRTVLEALLATRHAVQIDLQKNIVFIPYGNPFLSSTPVSFADLTAEQFADNVRIRLKRFISHYFRRGKTNLEVLLLAPELEALFLHIEFVEVAKQKAILQEISTCLPADRMPVMLTTSDLRRSLRKFIEIEFPDLAVLSYQELAPDLSIVPVVKIQLPA